MNLHQLVASTIASVNPPTRLSIQTSAGYTTNLDGTQVPAYNTAVSVFGDVQALDAGENQHLDALNIQGRRMKFYINGNIDGLIRPNQQGGDLITIVQGGNNQQLIGSTWLVAVILEYWPAWCCVAAVLQNDSSYPNSPYVQPASENNP